MRRECSVQKQDMLCNEIHFVRKTVVSGWAKGQWVGALPEAPQQHKRELSHLSPGLAVQRRAEGEGTAQWLVKKEAVAARPRPMAVQVSTFQALLSRSTSAGNSSQILV